MYFNNNPVSSATMHKYLGMMAIDNKLNYKHHLNFVIDKVQKAIRVLYKFQPPTTDFNHNHHNLQIFYLYYGDIVYDRTFDELDLRNLESIQYTSAIALTGASSEKLFQESLESLKMRLWLKKMFI